MGRLGWILTILGGAAAVGGVAYAASGGTSTPATPTPEGSSGGSSSSGSSSAGSTPLTPVGTTVSSSSGSGPSSAGAAVGAVGTIVPDGVMVAAAENALALLSSKGKVPGLSYSAPASAASGSSNYADDPNLPGALSVFQAWANATIGGYRAPAGQVMLLNTSGKLDMQTFAALTAAAAAA